ncbi:MAG: hypothetical protein H0W72_13195 [Planctomycetes bacterium]|nr:hypothetical protein [Planctomycetota bacterium]
MHATWAPPCAVFLSLVCGPAGAADQSNELGLVPRAAREALLAIASGKTISDVDREVLPDGTLSYEARIGDGGDARTVCVDTRGRVFPAMPRPDPLSGVPAAVRAGIERHAPGRITDADQILDEDGRIGYEIDTANGGRSQRIRLDPSGEVLH